MKIETRSNNLSTRDETQSLTTTCKLVLTRTKNIILRSGALPKTESFQNKLLTEGERSDSAEMAQKGLRVKKP